MDEDAYQAYRSVVESPALRSIWKTVYGARFWTGVDPPWTLATVDDVQFATERLSPQKTCRLVDLGCGSGALARHLARDFGALIEGLDANPNAIRLAQERNGDRYLSSRISFRAGDIGTTGFPDSAFDGAASLDVLLFVADKAKVLREIARILKPDARFAGTTFELGTPSAALAAPAFIDYPSAFTAAGFAVEVYEEAEGWRELLQRVTGEILASEAKLGREIHPLALQRVCAWARKRPSELGDSRRTRFCCRRPA